MIKGGKRPPAFIEAEWGSGHQLAICWQYKFSEKGGLSWTHRLK